MSGRVLLLARVSCRSEGQGEERPVAVWLGGERIAVRRVLADAVLGPATAGSACERRLEVELHGGDRLELTRRLPDGVWRVRKLDEDSAGSWRDCAPGGPS